MGGTVLAYIAARAVGRAVLAEIAEWQRNMQNAMDAMLSSIVPNVNQTVNVVEVFHEEVADQVVGVEQLLYATDSIIMILYYRNDTRS